LITFQKRRHSRVWWFLLFKWREDQRS